MDGRSGSHAENETVETQAKASEEKQGRAVLRHEWKDRSRQRNLKGSGVAGSEIVNDTGEKHVKKAAANLVLSVRAAAAGELHGRNGFAAKGALREMRRNVLAAKYTTALIHDWSCHCTHAASHTSLPRLESLSLNRQGMPCGRVNAGFEKFR